MAACDDHISYAPRDWRTNITSELSISHDCVILQRSDTYYSIMKGPMDRLRYETRNPRKSIREPSWNRYCFTSLEAWLGNIPTGDPVIRSFSTLSKLLHLIFLGSHAVVSQLLTNYHHGGSASSSSVSLSQYSSRVSPITLARITS